MKPAYFSGVLFALALLSFAPANTTIEFSYPSGKEIAVIMTSGRFKKMEQEARGADYYYLAQDDDSMICSVLFFKLNEDEISNLVEMPAKLMGAPLNSPAYPQTYFANYSNTKEWETNEQRWGDPKDDFMYRQTDIKEFKGQKVNQKNMFAYAMFGNDLFVNIHLSKINCSKKDSIEMKSILASLKKRQ